MGFIFSFLRCEWLKEKLGKGVSLTMYHLHDRPCAPHSLLHPHSKYQEIFVEWTNALNLWKIETKSVRVQLKNILERRLSTHPGWIPLKLGRIVRTEREKKWDKMKWWDALYNLLHNCRWVFNLEFWLFYIWPMSVLVFKQRLVWRATYSFKRSKKSFPWSR